MATPTITFQQAAFEALKLLDGIGADGFIQGVATSGSSTVQLEDLNVIKSTINQPNLHTDKWLWRPGAVNSGDVTSVVATYTPNLGLLVPDTQPWTAAPYTGGVGETWCLSKTLSPAQLYDCANRALRHMFFNSETTFPPNADPLVRRYDLATVAGAAWLTEEWMVRQVGFLNANMTRPDYEPLPVRGTKEKYDGVVYIRVPGGHPVTDTFYVKTVRPHFTYINGATSAVGVAVATDTVTATLDWWAWGIVTFAWDEYSEFFSTRQDLDRVKAAVAKAASRFTAERERRFRLLPDTFEASELISIRRGASYDLVDDGGLTARK